ncbi:ABC transporter permease [Marinilongibacter aquaticus]|uniref:ABC transporter permease n=1 Tax=Marinilongibacter aquaticus TaxID=2975157 RepID=UPI0021BD683B|nr:ABC transporter permease [Marinilongibacter aquaticus]UBM57294.1 ABC transporter permease [Marinilongibacter aquaticus]
MLRNYLKIAWRSLLKNKGFSFINIGGLAVGMAVAMMISLWINYEFSFGNEHENKDQIFNVVTNGIDSNTGNKFTTQSTPMPLYTELKKEIPEIKHAAITNRPRKDGLMAGEVKLTKTGVDVSEDFFQIFKFPFIEGDRNTALSDPNSIVLTQSTAKSLFGDTNALNKTVRWNNTQNLKVSGILKDIPQSTFFGDLEYFIPFSNFENRESYVQYIKDSWSSYDPITYVELIPNASREKVLPKIKNMLQQHNNSTQNELGMHAMAEWRLYNVFDNWKASGGRIEYVKMFAFIALLVLLLACINFTNLSTAKSEQRAREIGVRKAMGSERKQIMTQFMAESFLMSSFSILFSLILLIPFISAFNTILDTHVKFPVSNPSFWGIVLATSFLTGFLSGAYPAFYLSSFSSLKALKAKFYFNNSLISPRKVLVMLQFVASIILIIGTMVVYQQIEFTRSRPKGYNADKVIMVNAKGDLAKNYNAIRNELMDTGLIENVTKASNAISNTLSNTVIDDFPGQVGDEKMSLVTVATGGNYFKTLKINLLEGRDFNALDFEVDKDKVILNEAAIERMNIQDPIGKYIRDWYGVRREIIGVVANSIMESPFEKVRAAQFICDPNWVGVIMFRVKENTMTSKALDEVGPIFTKFNPSMPFEYSFADEEYGKKFQMEVMVGKLATFFAVLAIFISCLGLLGLIGFMAQKRTREIGIRKVLGASVQSLWRLLSREFVVLVLLASLVASPIAWYLMNRWLQNYTYHTEIGWWIFVAAAFATLTITLLTVSYQSIKTALMNPVKSLRSE